MGCFSSLVSTGTRFDFFLCNSWSADLADNRRSLRTHLLRSSLYLYLEELLDKQSERKRYDLTISPWTIAIVVPAPPTTPPSAGMDFFRPQGAAPGTGSCRGIVRKLRVTPLYDYVTLTLRSASVNQDALKEREREREREKGKSSQGRVYVCARVHVYVHLSLILHLRARARIRYILHLHR